MEDKDIVKLFFDRDEDALTQVEQKYGNYCFSLANAILNNREDSQEAVSDTWLKAWNSIPPQRPQVLKLYLAKITRNQAFNTYRRNSARKRGGGETELVLEELAGCIPARGNMDDELNLRELGLVIQNFLKTQSPRDRGIFISRYFFLEDCGTIGKRYGVTEGNAYRILSRVRKKLKDHLNQEGYAI